MEPNVAAGLAYLFGWVGGLIMLFGGGTNKFVKWAAAQAITTAIVIIVAFIAYTILGVILHFIPVIGALIMVLLYFAMLIVFAIAWLYPCIMAFQGKEVRLPIVADLTTRLFGSQLA